MSNFQHVPVDLSCKLFDSLIRPIILYNSEIWFMEEYFPIYKAKSRAILHGTTCDILSLTDKFNMEKVHHKFCKSVLGIKKTASNIAAKAELGRLPLDSFVKTQVILYYIRINCPDINPLVKDALSMNKALSDEGIYTWYTFVKEIFKEFNLNEEDLLITDKPFYNIKNPIKKSTKPVIKQKYDELILGKLSTLDDSSKLFLYSKLKTEIRMEDYLSDLKNFNSRKILTKLRLSDHNLEIEVGRYKKIPREQRLCKTCNILDDEYHFFLNCNICNNIRNNFYIQLEN